MPVSRFSISIEEDLLNAVDQYVKDNHFANRSQALRALIEKNLVEKKWQCDNMVAGAVIMLYDHHKKDIQSKSNDIQHDYHDVILSAQHFHLSHENCLEIIALKGRATRLTDLSDKLLAIKGLRHGKLVMSKTD
ncbi:MAG: nickel-responsive transcriptional regulator NikR [Bacteroidales bacterium]